MAAIILLNVYIWYISYIFLLFTKRDFSDCILSGIHFSTYAVDYVLVLTVLQLSYSSVGVDVKLLPLTPIKKRLEYQRLRQTFFYSFAWCNVKKILLENQLKISWILLESPGI